MPQATFVIMTIFLFLAIVGGLIGIVIEGRRVPAVAHNPATRDTMFPIVGWGILFAIYLLVEYVGVQNLTAEFRLQLGTLAVLPLFYAVLSTAWLIWRSGRRIVARVRGGEPTWRAIPLLDRLAFPLAFLSAILSAATEWLHDGFSLAFFVLASVVVLLVFIRKRPQPQ